MLRFTRGFSLIDVIVGIALLLVLFLALFGILRASLVLSTLAKAKAGATEVANSQIEYMRGLSYDTLGVVGGIPAGTIPQNATSTIDGVTYATRTFIEYYDDPADGVGTSDTNNITTDYKTGKVTVSYALYGLTRSITLISNFVPPNGEAATNGGALSLHVVDALGADMSGVTVQIVNSAVTPAVNFSTFTNIAGLATIGGAATSSQYQIYVSRTGYSSAQTYARTGTNVNPTPGYLTVVKNQTTTSTFAIDRLASLIIASFSPAVTTAFSDSFSSASNLASQVNTEITSGALTLVSQALSGTARSISFSPSSLAGWGILSATISTPNGTSVIVRVDDTSGTPLPDSVLPGNSIGFSSFPIFLTSIATSSYPGLSLEANLTSTATTTTPSISAWSLSHTEAPQPLINVSFTLTGAKTIGTDSNLLPLYKTIVSDTTGASGSKNESLEWDSYTLSLGSAYLIESCLQSPYTLAPNEATSTALIVGALTTNTLPVLVIDTASSSVPQARVVLTKSDYAGTVFTSSCGLAFFNNLGVGNYTASVSAVGHVTTVFPNISVTGNTPAVTLTLP